VSRQNRPLNPVHVSEDPPGPAVPGWPAGAAALAGLAAGWIASGGVGMMSHALRHVLTWLALAVAVLADRPGALRSASRWLALLGGVVAAVAMTTSNLLAVNVLGAAVLLAAVAADRAGPARRAMLPVALAVGVLGVWRLALGIGTFWTLTDRLGGLLGRFAGLIAGRPLWVGATFGGLDFLAVMGVFYAGWVLAGCAPGWRRKVAAGAAVFLGHMTYLVVLAYAPALKAALPAADPAKGFSLASAAHAALPWNVPAVGAAIHLAVAGLMLRWALRPAEEQAAPAAAAPAPAWVRPAGWLAALALAALLPVVTTLSLGPCKLTGKKVLANEKGFLNWLKPQHGQYGRLSIGMYGMMPEYFTSLGAKFARTEQITAEKLGGADLFVLIYPDDPWEHHEPRVLREYVRNGGSLLVLGEHTVGDADGNSRFNEVLKGTRTRVRFDSATFAIGGWLQSYQTADHPTTAGIEDERNTFGAVIGASVEADWPAVPLLVGRWGWADPGQMGGSAHMGNHEYDPGEKLGDLVLAAEEPYGAGRIITFGDTSGFTNGITIGAHPFTSRLYGYLASKASSPQALWRQFVGLLLAGGLVGVLIWRHEPMLLAVAGVVLAGVLGLCTRATARAADVLPDGRLRAPNNLAYVDTTHMEAANAESWRPEGLAGLYLTLMRNGYLALNLNEFTRERLQRAGLVISVAPNREFTPAERKAVQEFVRGGGVFLCMVDYDDSGPASSLLKDFGFGLGEQPPGPDGKVPEPQPMGHFKVPYVQAGDRQAFVRYHASWGIYSTAPPEETRDIALGRANVPVIKFRRVGDAGGKFVLIGDTGFAMNKNLENRDGQPFEGKRENADFWRWFLTLLRDQPMWNPLAGPEAPEDPNAGGEEAGQ